MLILMLMLVVLMMTAPSETLQLAFSCWLGPAHAAEAPQQQRNVGPEAAPVDVGLCQKPPLLQSSPCQKDMDAW